MYLMCDSVLKRKIKMRRNFRTQNREILMQRKCHDLQYLFWNAVKMVKVLKM